MQMIIWNIKTSRTTFHQKDKCSDFKMGKRLEEKFLQRRQTNYHQDVARYWTSLIIKEKQIKDIMKCRFTPARMVLFKKTRSNKYCEGCREKETFVLN